MRLALCCKGTLLNPGQLLVHQDPQVLFCKAAFQMVGPQPVLLSGVIPTQMQDFAFSLVELREIPLILIIQSVKVPLNGNTIL